MQGEDFGGIEKEWVFEETLKAPINEGDIIGCLVYRLNGKELGRVRVLAAEYIKQATFFDALKKAAGAIGV